MKFNFKDIQKYCINLKRSTERRRIMQELFHEMKMQVSFFDGFDAAAEGVPQLLQKPVGVYGCMKAHYLLIDFAKRNKLPAICIFEDDVVFCDDFADRIRYIENLDDFDFDIFSLGGHWYTLDMPNAVKETQWPHIYQSLNLGGTYAYIITEKVYDFILQNMNYNFGVDEFYGNHVYRRFKSYAMTPFLVGCRPCISEVTGNDGEYENVKWFYQQEKFDLTSPPFTNAHFQLQTSNLKPQTTLPPMDESAKKTWDAAQAAEIKAHGFEDFQTGFDHYADAYRQYFQHLDIDADMKGKSVLEIGPALYPALSHCQNLGPSFIIEPLKTATLERCIEGKPISLITEPAEALEKFPEVDEVWFFNLLTHVIDPTDIINKAKACCKVIRFFEPIHQMLDVMHLHEFSMESMRGYFGDVVKNYPKNGTAVNFHQHECAYGVYHTGKQDSVPLTIENDKNFIANTIAMAGSLNAERQHWKTNGAYPIVGLSPLSSVTFIIPVRIESADREFNFLRVIQYLCDNFITKIIIKESDSGESKVKELLKRINHVECEIVHIFEHTDDPIFHRTRLLNEMLMQVKTPVTVNYDIDVFMRPEAHIEAADAIIDGGYDLVYPYAKGEGNELFGKAQRAVFFPDKQNYNGEDLFNEKYHKAWSSLCGHCQFFKTKSYIEGGMENEEFISYGAEDVERMERFIRMGYKVNWLPNAIYHLEHSRGLNSNQTNPHFNKNEELYRETITLSKEQLIEKYNNMPYLNKYKIRKPTPGKPKLVLVTYADKKYKQNQVVLTSRATVLNCFDEICDFTREDVEKSDFYKEHKHILDQERGAGYWLWKSHIILAVLDKLNEGDILLYMDCGDWLEKGEGLREMLFKKMEDEKLDFLLTDGAYKNSEWTKKDCFVLMNCDSKPYHNATQLEAGIIVCRKTKRTEEILYEWLFFCRDEQILTDKSNMSGDNYPGFKDHRHDQSILTNLKVMHNLYSGSEMREFITCNKSLEEVK